MTFPLYSFGVANDKTKMLNAFNQFKRLKPLTAIATRFGLLLQLSQSEQIVRPSCFELLYKLELNHLFHNHVVGFPCIVNVKT